MEETGMEPVQGLSSSHVSLPRTGPGCAAPTSCCGWCWPWCAVSGVLGGVGRARLGPRPSPPAASLHSELRGGSGRVAPLLAAPACLWPSAQLHGTPGGRSGGREHGTDHPAQLRGAPARPVRLVGGAAGLWHLPTLCHLLEHLRLRPAGHPYLPTALKATWSLESGVGLHVCPGVAPCQGHSSQAKPYCSPGFLPRPGGEGLQGQWLKVPTVSPRTYRAPCQDLWSEPFWRMNKYFAQQEMAVPRVQELVWPMRALLPGV